MKDTIIRPYGDTSNDGKMQFSFTLPVSADEYGLEAARLLLNQIGLEDIEVCGMRDMNEGFTHFIAYAVTDKGVDPKDIKVKVVDTPVMDMEATDAYIKEHLGR